MCRNIFFAELSEHVSPGYQRIPLTPHPTPTPHPPRNTRRYIQTNILTSILTRTKDTDTHVHLYTSDGIKAECCIIVETLGGLRFRSLDFSLQEPHTQNQDKRTKTRASLRNN